jgi:hypothetical protein
MGACVGVYFNLTLFPLHTANEGPVRIQYKCLVPIYVFPEFQNRIIMFCLPPQFLHSYICKRFTYFQDRSVYFAADKYVDPDPGNI